MLAIICKLNAYLTPHRYRIRLPSLLPNWRPLFYSARPIYRLRLVPDQLRTSRNRKQRRFSSKLGIFYRWKLPSWLPQAPQRHLLVSSMMKTSSLPSRLFSSPPFRLFRQLVSPHVRPYLEVSSLLSLLFRLFRQLVSLHVRPYLEVS